MSEPVEKDGWTYGWITIAPNALFHSIESIVIWPSYQERLENGDCDE